MAATGMLARAGRNQWRLVAQVNGLAVGVVPGDKGNQQHPKSRRPGFLSNHYLIDMHFPLLKKRQAEQAF